MRDTDFLIFFDKVSWNICSYSPPLILRFVCLHNLFPGKINERLFSSIDASMNLFVIFYWVHFKVSFVRGWQKILDKVSRIQKTPTSYPNKIPQLSIENSNSKNHNMLTELRLQNARFLNFQESLIIGKHFIKILRYK